MSILFLIFFAYIIVGLQWALQNYLQGQNQDIFLGSVSDGVKSVAPQNITSDIVQNLIPNTAKDDTQDAAPHIIPNPVQPIAAPEVNAKAAISIESNLRDADRIIFEKDIDVRLPIASLTKVNDSSRCFR